MLNDLTKDRVFYYFAKIASIPHGSGNTGALADYCLQFAAVNNLDGKKDEFGNVIIKKPASSGYEKRPAVILQGHLDMVCEKTPDCNIDFKKDGLSLVLDGDLLSADGTTLGADDGIAVAMILAILENKELCHPNIEAVFTVDEETGMIGAENLNTAPLFGKTLINIDSGDEGVLTVGCAGGAKIDIKLPMNTEKNKYAAQKVTVSGLLGGHSGIDINKGRLNADMLLGKFLKELPFEYRLVSISGGFKDNVIPNLAECVIACDKNLTSYTAEFTKNNQTESDPGMSIAVTSADSISVCYDKPSTERAVEFLNRIKFGITAMSPDIPNAVQSSQNLGILTSNADEICAVLSVRSSVATDKQDMLDELKAVSDDLGAEMSTHGHYPAWEYRKDSPLRKTMERVYLKLYGNSPTVETVHAGLECGLWGEKIKNLDAVSMGPDMWDIHTANERLSVSSTKRTYKYLCEVLKEL